MRLSVSGALGSRLMMTSCGASLRPSSAGSESELDTCDETTIPNRSRKPASSERLFWSESTMAQFSRVLPLLARQVADLARVESGDDFRRDDHDELRLAALVAHRPEQRPDDRQVAEQRRHVLVGDDAVVEQARDREALALVQLDG